MRKDFKKGLFIGTGLCLVGLVWFCAVERISSSSPCPMPGGDIETAETSGTVIYEPLRQEEKTITPTPPQQSKIATTPLPVSPPVKMIIHTVKSGQTLSDISKMYYNTTQNWKKIYEANKQMFPKGPNAIKTGIKLVIPK